LHGQQDHVTRFPRRLLMPRSVLSCFAFFYAQVLPEYAYPIPNEDSDDAPKSTR